MCNCKKDKITRREAVSILMYSPLYWHGTKEERLGLLQEFMANYSEEYYSCPGTSCGVKVSCLRSHMFPTKPCFSNSPLKDNGKCHFFDDIIKTTM